MLVSCIIGFVSLLSIYWIIQHAGCEFLLKNACMVTMLFACENGALPLH